MKNRRIIVISYGTSSPEAIKSSIEPLEDAIQKAFPDFDVYRAFTGKKIRECLCDKYDISTDSPGEALERAYSDGVKNIIIQPTLLSFGKEYYAMAETLGKNKYRFEKFIISPPVTDKTSDIEAIADILKIRASSLPEYSAILYVGHGSKAGADKYKELQQILIRKNVTNIFISTLSDVDNIEALSKKISEAGYTHCLLLPFFIVCGTHSDKDIGGSDDNSWLSRLNMSGIITEYHSESLGSLPEIQDLFIKHIRIAAGIA